MHRRRTFLALPVVFVLIPLVLGPFSAGAQGVSLKLFGVYGSIANGDIQDGLKGGVDFYRGIFDLAGWGISGDFEHFDNVWEAGGDLVFYFSPVLGIGLGSGYMQTLPGKTRMTFSDPPLPDVVQSLDPQVTVIPVRASMYASIPLGTALNIILHGGVSYYFASMKYTWRLGTDTSWVQVAGNADGSGLGFHAGAGLEFNFSSNAALFVEAAGRMATLSGLTGESTLSTHLGSSPAHSGTVYYFKDSFGVLGTLPQIVISDTAPSGGGITDVREAELDLSGFSLRAGFRIRV